jgi:hypothetical protein
LRETGEGHQQRLTDFAPQQTGSAAHSQPSAVLSAFGEARKQKRPAAYRVGDDEAAN